MERKWWTLIVVCIATFMLLLDITIVNVALPKIAGELKASFSQIQWVIDAYSLTLASGLLTAGFLIGARAGQGIGGSIMFATSLSLLVQEFQGRERGMALGVWGATI